MARSTTELYRALLAAFDRRLVVDIVAGASAGGLNGALLAGAIAHDRPLTADFLRQNWITIGDFALLLQPLSAKNPASLMQGSVFLDRVTSLFEELLDGRDPPAGAGCDGREPVMLDVQVTDVLGRQHCFTDAWDVPFFATEYRAPARFRRFDDYRADTLAAVARASSSFPAAFEAQELTGRAAALMGLPGRTRWAIDGGLLENAPIKPVLELISRVSPELPSKRYVCYVNAAPTEYVSEGDAIPGQPDLLHVLAYTFNLPRDGRVIDQVYALDDAARRAGADSDAGVSLLSLSPDALRQIAGGLLPAYQERRAILSLTELLGDRLEGRDPRGGPGRARLAIEGVRGLAPDLETSERPEQLLPWIPNAVTPPDTPAEWRWGIRAAQRVLQLQLDALRAGLRALDYGDDPAPIINALPRIGRAVQALDRLCLDFVDPTGAASQAAQRLLCPKNEQCQQALDELTDLCEGIGGTVFGVLESATAAFVTAYRSLPEASLTRAKLPNPDALLEPENPEKFASGLGPVVAFLDRALPIETIRRSFADDFDIDSGESISVAQLTPLIRSPLFDRPRPRPEPLESHVSLSHSGGANSAAQIGPRTARDKLCGLRLGHFGGFYRSSWRANDFMWGRLDGAAAIARLLIDPERARAQSGIKASTRAPEYQPWEQLTRALMPPIPIQDPSDAERLDLIIELLSDGSDSAAGAVLSAEQPEQVREALLETLRTSLLDNRERAWELCARALQYEILREEAPHLIRQVEADKAEGAERVGLDWEIDDGRVMPIIERLRNGYDPKRGYVSLPEQLGCDDPDEATSTLALRTISKTMLVALAALTGSFPLARVLQPVRLPLFAIQGATAPRTLDRLAVTLGYAGAAWYLAARWLTTPAPGTDSSDVPLKAVWSPQVIVLWLAILAIIGVAVIPIVRAISGRSIRRRLWAAVVAVTFLVCGGAVALIWQWTLRGTVEALTTWHASFAPPTWLLWAVAGVAGLHVVSSIDTVLRVAGPVIKRLGRWVSVQSLTYAAAGTALSWAAAPKLWHIGANSGMKTLCAGLAFTGPLAVAAYVSVGPALVKRIRVAAGIAGAASSSKPGIVTRSLGWLRRKVVWWRD